MLTVDVLFDALLISIIAGNFEIFIVVGNRLLDDLAGVWRCGFRRRLLGAGANGASPDHDHDHGCEGDSMK